MEPAAAAAAAALLCAQPGHASRHAPTLAQSQGLPSARPRWLTVVPSAQQQTQSSVTRARRWGGGRRSHGRRRRLVWLLFGWPDCCRGCCRGCCRVSAWLCSTARGPWGLCRRPLPRSGAAMPAGAWIDWRCAGPAIAEGGRGGEAEEEDTVCKKWQRGGLDWLQCRDDLWTISRSPYKQWPAGRAKLCCRRRLPAARSAPAHGAAALQHRTAPQPLQHSGVPPPGHARMGGGWAGPKAGG